MKISSVDTKTTFPAPLIENPRCSGLSSGLVGGRAMPRHAYSFVGCRFGFPQYWTDCLEWIQWLVSLMKWAASVGHCFIYYVAPLCPNMQGEANTTNRQRWCLVLTVAPGKPLSPGKPRKPGGPSLPGDPCGPGSPCKHNQKYLCQESMLSNLQITKIHFSLAILCNINNITTGNFSAFSFLLQDVYWGWFLVL